MRPSLALLRAGLPSRLGVLGATLCLSCAARLLDSDDVWQGSDNQIYASMVLSYVLLPVLAAMFGAALVRGEHAPWHFGLARPISRGRWAATCVAMDAATIGMAVVTARMVVGTPPHILGHEAWQMVSFLWNFAGGPVPVVVTLAYLASAVGASHGHATLRALPTGMAYCAIFYVLTASCLWLDTGLAGLFLVDAWSTPSRAGLLDFTAVRSLLVSVEILFTSVAIAIAVWCSLVHIIVRAMRRAPVLLRRRDVFTVFASWLIIVSLTSWAVRSRVWAIADAPLLARRGDATLVVALRDDPHWNHFILVERDCDECFARVAQRRFHPVGSADVRFEDVVEGTYRICETTSHGSVEIRFGLARAHVSHPVRERCIEVELAAGVNRIQSGFGSSAGVPSPYRLLEYERHEPLAKLLVFRSLANSVLLALQPVPGFDDEEALRGAPRSSR